MHKAMSERFDQVQEEGCIESKVQHHHTSDTKHGRRENRYYFQASIPESLKELTDSWKGAKLIGQVLNITVRDGKETSEIRDYLSSKPVSAKCFAQAVRAHWGIENSFHWVMDMTFHEDQSQIRKDQDPDDFTPLPRFVINNLNLDTSKESTRKKRKLAAWDENNLLNLLAANGLRCGCPVRTIRIKLIAVVPRRTDRGEKSCTVCWWFSHLSCWRRSPSVSQERKLPRVDRLGDPFPIKLLSHLGMLERLA